mmetsp:Transcript_37048/g.86139  ORF Transcript_37048/g.86139 Transcript_37048/m.86139 type:complete len:186 (-) Transcript_37048:36-593(-)
MGRNSVCLLSDLVLLLGADATVDLIDKAAQAPGAFAGLFGNIWLANAPNVVGNLDRKITLLALIKILTEVQSVIGDVALWSRTLEVVVGMVETVAPTPVDTEGAGVDVPVDVEVEHVVADAYSPLHFASRPVKDPFPQVQDARQQLVVSLHQLSTKLPGQLAGRISPPAQEPLGRYLATSGVSLA